jgi:GTPase SAR1 family protein
VLQKNQINDNAFHQRIAVAIVRGESVSSILEEEVAEVEIEAIIDEMKSHPILGTYLCKPTKPDTAPAPTPAPVPAPTLVLEPSPAPTPTPTPTPEPAAPKPQKPLSLLFIGGTGAGKTTLINSFYFFAQNKPLDQIEALVKTKFLPGKVQGSETDSSDQTQSQTTRAEVHSFTIETPDAEYEVKVMDTPGLGDTRGLSQDDANISTIVSTVEKTPELNAVFFILNGAQSRLTSHIQYVIQKLKGMLPNVFKNNLFLILTNSPIKENLELYKKVLDVHPDRQIAIDNSIFSGILASLTLCLLTIFFSGHQDSLKAFED